MIDFNLTKEEDSENKLLTDLNLTVGVINSRCTFPAIWYSKRFNILASTPVKPYFKEKVGVYGR